MSAFHCSQSKPLFSWIFRKKLFSEKKELLKNELSKNSITTLQAFYTASNNHEQNLQDSTLNHNLMSFLKITPFLVNFGVKEIELIGIWSKSYKLRIPNHPIEALISTWITLKVMGILLKTMKVQLTTQSMKHRKNSLTTKKLTKTRLTPSN